MLFALFALLALASALDLQLDCTAGCEQLCPDAACGDRCMRACRTPQTAIDEPYHQIETIADLGDDWPVTGSDAPWPRGTHMWFTTRLGRVYRIDFSDNSLHVVHDFKGLMIYTEDGCGLYDIAFDRHYATNRRVFLYTAMKPMKPGEHHTNAVLEYSYWGGKLDYVRHVASFPHDAPISHGWAKFTTWRLAGDSNMLISNHGADNTMAIMQYNASGDDHPVADWAFGVGECVSCDRSIYKAERASCLLRTERGTDFYELRRSHSHDCEGRNCQSAQLSFDARLGCPVETVALWSSNASRIRADVYLHRAACVRNGAFRPAQLLRRYRDYSAHKYDTVEMSAQTDDGLVWDLHNTTLITADRYNALFVAGHSPRYNRYVLQRVVQVRHLQ